MSAPEIKQKSIARRIEDVVAEAARLLADQGVCPGSEVDECFSVDGYECGGDSETCWTTYLNQFSLRVRQGGDALAKAGEE